MKETKKTNDNSLITTIYWIPDTAKHFPFNLIEYSQQSNEVVTNIISIFKWGTSGLEIKGLAQDHTQNEAVIGIWTETVRFQKHSS